MKVGFVIAGTSQRVEIIENWLFSLGFLLLRLPATKIALASSRPKLRHTDSTCVCSKILLSIHPPYVPSSMVCNARRAYGEMMTTSRIKRLSSALYGEVIYPVTSARTSIERISKANQKRFFQSSQIESETNSEISLSHK